MIIVEKKTLKIIPELEFRDAYKHVSFPAQLNEKSFNDTEFESKYEIVTVDAQPLAKAGEIYVLSKPYKERNKILVKWVLSKKELTENDKSEYLSVLTHRIETRINSYKTKYPDFEIETWTKQEIEANAYRVDSGAETPLLDAIASSRGINKTDLVDKVLSKSADYTAFVGDLIGQRLALESRVKSAKTFDELPELP